MIYLRSYDTYKETLEYDVDTGASRLVSREEVERAGVQRTFGMFTRVGDRFFGVYATPEGPVFFGDDIRVLGRFGVTRGHVELDKATRIHRFALFDDSRLVLSTHYPEREGLGTNPYDTEPEDVDMFAAIAKGTESRQFFENYRRG
ncbi:hypothetical protein M8A51_24745 [Schlegelella sp. S2-27]|uniref:Uncharacterized protein n=1 Tax=Caldimonas mangrovi TaxID=2944811 RepID=A0ABT0YVY7_9BURK|nr:hypothetical protein [Caldimonas mangrovi]MCM5682753.1 hypothetical protein [Caldimonas mangrovi]